MKTQKLIPLLDYVLEQTGKIKPGCDYTNDQILIRIAKYAKFLSQPLKISMFIVCDENQVPLEEPRMEYYDSMTGWNCPEDARNYQDKLESYNKAKSNVLFEDFSLIGNNHVEHKGFVVGLGFKNGIFKTIEDLTKHNNTKNILTLTENAVKLING